VLAAPAPPPLGGQAGQAGQLQQEQENRCATSTGAPEVGFGVGLRPAPHLRVSSNAFGLALGLALAASRFLSVHTAHPVALSTGARLRVCVLSVHMAVTNTQQLRAHADRTCLFL
jgi:hypothetical protein